MTRREIERIAEAIRPVPNGIRESVAGAIGDAIGLRGELAWRKWWKACGITPDAVDHMVQKARGVI